MGLVAKAGYCSGCVTVVEREIVSMTYGQAQWAQPLQVLSGNSPAQATVRLYRPVEDLHLDGPSQMTLKADLEGRVLLPDAARTSIAVVESPGRAIAVIRPPFPEQIVLKPGRGIKATLIGEHGPEKGYVSWRFDPKLRLSIQTDADGVAQFDGLPMDEVDLTGMIGRLTRSVRVSLTAASVVFHILPAVSVSGRVLDPNGRPIDGATVAVVRDVPYAVRKGVSSKEGRFNVETVPLGESHIEVLAPGWRDEWIPISLRAGSDVSLPPIYLSPEAEVRGVILNESTGEPVAGARVIVENPDTSTGALRDLLDGPRSLLTNGEGIFRLRGARPEPLQLAVDAPGLARTRLEKVDVPADGLLDLGAILIGPGTTLVVEVTDLSDGPIPRQRLSIDRGPAISAGSALEAETDGTGLARFDRLGAGRYRLRVGGSDRPGESGPRRLQWLDLDGSVGDKEVKVSLATLSLRLHVEQAFLPDTRLAVTVGPAAMDLQPQEASPIRIVRGDEVRLFNKPAGAVKAGLTDERGDVQVDDVDPGDLRVGVQLGLSKWSTLLSLNVMSTRQEIHVPRNVVPVTVMGAAGPLAGAHVQVDYQNGIRLEGDTLEDGSTRLLGSQALGAVLIASAAGHRERRINLPSSESTPQTVTLDSNTDGGSIRVRVMTESGEALAGALVSAIHQDSPERRSAISDDGGVALLSRLPSGSKRLIVRREPFAPLTTVSVASSDRETIDRTVVLERGQLVEIVAPTSSGKLPFSILVRDSDGNLINSLLGDGSALSVEPEGSARIGPLSIGRYSIELRAGVISKKREFQVADKLVRLEIR